MEKPTERARDGMASDRAASTPGPTMASDASIPASPKKATGTDGASANSTANPEATTAATASITNTRCSDLAASRVPTVAPTTRPASTNTCTGAVR